MQRATDNETVTPAPAGKNIVYLLLAALLAVHLALVLSCFQPAISSPDANGYFKQARLIAEQGRTWFRTDSPLQFVAPHWMDAGDGTFYSKYPPGLPMLAAAVYKLAGPTAALLIDPILTALTLLGLFLLCRRWTGPWFALWAVAVMAANPLVNQHALFADSHAAAAFMLVWGVYCLVRWSDDFSPGWGAVAGLLLGTIPTVRYAGTVYGLGVAIFIVLTLGRSRSKVRAVLPLAAGAALPLVLLLARNQAAFGAFWKTGYSLSGEQTGFGLGYFLHNSYHYLADILGQGAGITTVLALAGICLMLSRRDSRSTGILLAGLIVPVTLLYMSYYFFSNAGGEAWPTLRFLLPTFYLYALASTWLLNELGKIFAGAGRPLALAALAFSLWWGVPYSATMLVRQQRTAKPLAEITGIVTDKVPQGSVLIAPRQVQQQLDFIGGWKLADEMFFTAGRMPSRGMMPSGGGQQEPGPMAGRRERMARIHEFQDPSGFGLSDKLRSELVRWSGGSGKVYWIGDPERIGQLVPEPDEIKTLARIELPSAVMQALGGMAPMGAGMGGPGMAGGPMGGRPGQMARLNGSEDSQLVLVEWTLKH